MRFCLSDRFLNLLIVLGALWGAVGTAQDNQPAFQIKGKTVTVGELMKEHQAQFYELEKQKYDLVERLARDRYLNQFWKELADKEKTTVDKAKADYLAENAKVSEKEFKETYDRLKDHPQLKDLSEKDKKDQINNYLKSQKEQAVVMEIIDKAMKDKSIVVTYKKPQEPVYDVPVAQTDQVRYGPKADDTKPLGCSNDCPITVIEYSEFQCPFCEKVQPAAQRLLEEYKGKVRWIVRDFPLGFHDRAKPAAIAAHCAGEQGKYWHMYKTLFENQRALSDGDLKGYAKKIGLDEAKYSSCVAKPDKAVAVIEKNYSSGEKLGVSGTPAFFINGRSMSGALPYPEFKRIFEEELSKGKQKKS